MLQISFHALPLHSRIKQFPKANGRNLEIFIANPVQSELSLARTLQLVFIFPGIRQNGLDLGRLAVGNIIVR